MRRPIIGSALGILASLAMASSVMAADCFNASKSDQSAGAQVVVNLTNGEVEWMTPGLAERIDQGVVDLATGQGFHGIIGLDFDGDGVVDVATWFGVGPDGEEIPDIAQLSGPLCRGLTSAALYFTSCLGG